VSQQESDNLDLPAAAAPAAAPRFCGRCGTPWQLEWTTCSFCASRSALRDGALELASHEKSGVLRALFLYALLLLVCIASIMIAVAQGSDLGLAGLSVEMVVLSAVILLPALGCFPMLKPSLLTIGPRRWLLLAPVLALFTFLLASLVVGALHSAFGMENLQYLVPFRGTPHEFALAALYIAVQPAIFEEIAFRGLLFGWFSTVLSNSETVLVTAGMFAILHLSILSLPHLLVLGVLLGWLRIKSGSLYPGMLLHFSHNFLCILVEYLWKQT
jgi:membrane protease YdiL (CAAX protease family)